LTFNNGQYVVALAKGEFHMYRPEAKISPITSSVGVYGDVILAFGDPNVPLQGITFWNTITIPPGFSGDPRWVQTFSSEDRSLQENNGTWHYDVFEGPGPWVDTGTPDYPVFLPGTTTPADSPLLGFGPAYSVATAADSAEMWMMFQPPGGMWVPLRAVQWHWNGAACKGANGHWALCGNPDHSTNLSDFDTEDYPVWKSNAKNSHWNPPLP
jgi:hypothetical protein